MEKTLRVNQDKKKLGTILEYSYMQKILAVARITFFIKEKQVSILNQDFD